ncbi:hypothetical protein BKA93DRAFT_823638 [Sparassis latifolia]
MSNRNSNRRTTYAAVLQRCAANFNVKLLADITLAHVLAGDTCAPISLSDFEAYLAHQEHTLEHLQFVVWFQDYRARFLALPEEIQAASPGPKQFTFALPTPARTAQRVAATSTDGRVPAAPFPGLPTVTEQPFRDECERIVATFLHPGAPKELPLEPALRDTLLRALSWNTHPDAFLLAYEELYALVEGVSLPRFLVAASANINLPKQLYWYGVGFVDLVVSILVTLLLVMLVPAPPEASRAWRLFAVPFAALGSMQTYSAWRGFCSQVWGRGATQLRVWEMHEMDDEAAAHWARALDPLPSPTLSPSSPTSPTMGGVQMRERAGAPVWDSQQSTLASGCPSMKASSSPGTSTTMSMCLGREDDMDLDAIAPFGSPEDKDKDGTLVRVGSASSQPSLGRTRCPPRLRIQPSSLSIKSAVDSGAPPAFSLADERDDEDGGFSRPPVFGPEKVVLDPRIQAVHRRVMRDILWVGFAWTAMFTAIVLAVPARRH